MNRVTLGLQVELPDWEVEKIETIRLILSEAEARIDAHLAGTGVIKTMHKIDPVRS